MTRVLSLLAIVLVTPSVSAEEFSWQLAGSYEKADTLTDLEIDTTTLEVTHFFRPVDDEIGPLALAPFLSRSSRITAVAQRSEEEGQVQGISYIAGVGGATVLSRRTDVSNVYAVSGRHVWQSSGWYVGGAIESYDLRNQTSNTVDISNDKDGYVLLGGKYFGRSTALELTAQSSQSTTDIVQKACPPIFACPFVLGYRIDTDDLGVSVLHVGGRGGLRYAVSGSVVTSDTTIEVRPTAGPAAFTSPSAGVPAYPAPGTLVGTYQAVDSAISFGTIRAYSVGGEIFPTTRLGVSLGYSDISGDTPLEERYEAATTWFFKRKIAVEFAVARAKLRFGLGGALDADQALIRFIGRL
jgi:hypothetical protein